MLTARQLSVLRGGRAIVDTVSATFRPGRLSVVLGPNGAGKSTLLRVLTGTLKPDRGEVLLGDRSLHTLAIEELAQRRAVLVQESMLQFDFSVEEVVLLGRIPHLTGWESAHDHDACERALALMELTAMRYRRYPTLSGGEKQRVHLARVLAQLDTGGQSTHEERWLFLDEPTSALDLRHQHSTLALARQLAVAQGLGVIAVIHDLNLALSYADEVLVLADGRTAAHGTPDDVLTAELIHRVYGVHALRREGRNGAPPFIQTHHPISLSNHA